MSSSSLAEPPERVSGNGVSKPETESGAESGAEFGAAQADSVTAAAAGVRKQPRLQWLILLRSAPFPGAASRRVCERGAHDLVPKLKSLFICAGPGLAGEMEEASGGIERPVAVGGGAVRRMENSSGDRTSWWCIRFPPGRKARWEVHVSVPQEPVTTDLKALPPDHLAVVAMLVANGGEWARKLGGALGAPFAGAHDEFERCFKVLFPVTITTRAKFVRARHALTQPTNQRVPADRTRVLDSKRDKLCERKVAHFVLQLRAESLACAPARR